MVTESASTSAPPNPSTDSPPLRTVRTVCVYCGSKPGRDPSFLSAAEELGREVAGRGLDLVYGGGNVGLMGAVARTVTECGRDVKGIIPRALMPREISGHTIGEVIVVADMHERKATMAKASDAFIALPGGFGTMEELLEMVTWSQLGIHSKAIGVLNVNGYYDHLLRFFDDAVEQGFSPQENRDAIISAPNPKELLDKVIAFHPSYKSPISKESWELGYLPAK